jgi:transposase
MDDKAEKVALFRYGLIAPLVLETLPRGELTRRAQQIAGRLYDIPHSTRRQVSVDTLLDWSLRYRRNGLAELSPQPRQDRGQTRAVAPEVATLIERLKRENPHCTGAALLRELAEQNQAGLSASTLYRFLRSRGLTERQLLLDKATAHKKYEPQFANQIWQSDMLFGPWVGRPGGGKRQVFLQAAGSHRTGDLLRRPAARPGAAGGCGDQRVIAALGAGGEVSMWESFFGFKKTPFSDSPDVKQLFASQTWNQVKTRLEFLAQHHGVGLITGEVGAGKSTAARHGPYQIHGSKYRRYPCASGSIYSSPLAGSDIAGWW